MASPREEVLESVNSDEMVEQGEVGSLKDLAPKNDLEDMEMSDCQSENVEVVEEGNVMGPRNTEDIDMDGEATEQSENLLDNSNVLLGENDVAASKGTVETANDGEGEQKEEPALEEEEYEQEAADGESQEDEDEVDQGEEGEESTMQKQTGEDVLKDTTNTVAEVKTDKLF